MYMTHPGDVKDLKKLVLLNGHIQVLQQMACIQMERKYRLTTLAHTYQVTKHF